MMSPTQMVVRRFFRSKLSILGLVMVVSLFLFCWVGPLVYTQWGPYDKDYSTKVSYDPEITVSFSQNGHDFTFKQVNQTETAMNNLAAPSKSHPLGTDKAGRDVLARLMQGGQISLTVSFLAVFVILILGTIFGGIAGYFGGWVDLLLMRVTEIFSSIPFLPFAMILSAIMGSMTLSETTRIFIIMCILGVLTWPGLARLVRGQVLVARESEYVTAAKAMGVKEGTIAFKHILPNVMSVILVNLMLNFGTCMLTESTLSYLGFGIAPPTPTWGNMLTGANNSVVIQQYWWRWVFPATVFGICTICINLVGDALRDAVDPKTNGR